MKEAMCLVRIIKERLDNTRRCFLKGVFKGSDVSFLIIFTGFSYRIYPITKGFNGRLYMVHPTITDILTNLTKSDVKITGVR